MTEGLIFQAVQLRYGRREVLQDVSLQVAPGTVVGLVGPNGVGKTSLARIAAGFTLPSGGHAAMAGLPPRAFRRLHGIGYAPEELPRVAHWTVGTLLSLRAAGTPGGEARGGEAREGRVHGAGGQAGSPHAGEFAHQVVRTLGLEGLLDGRVTRLSKGQWRLVVAAYAAIACPRLLILDEPDSGLDPGALDRLARLVALARSAGAVVLMLSHQLVELERSCDRVLFIRGGRIVAEEPGGSGVSLKTRYAEIFP
jgi:ABC-type multidrug transport system ATPase subunit